MKPEPITELNDARITPYRELKDKRLAQEQGLFVVEGRHLVRRLLPSEIKTHSILMTEACFASGPWDIPAGIPVYQASKEVLSSIVGFQFHRGVLGLGHRPALVPFEKAWDDIDRIHRLLICPEINDVENLGSILRTAAGLGFQHVLLGPACCDPWSRRAIRTSMGAVFQLEISRSERLEDDLERLRDTHGFEFHATVIDGSATPLTSMVPPKKVGLLMGSEAHGLSDQWQAVADQLVTIPMDLGADSLNVAIAAGIFMHHYRACQ
ncbi:MAG: RNA methyltransferase [Planctomycetes bacterium]|nr:RNA methyltransferase [Planctomycetota bacterium]